MNPEEIVQHLLEFVASNGKIPALNEPGLEKLIQQSIKTFGSLENALRVAGLIGENSAPLLQPGRKRRFPATKKRTARPQDKFQSYPEEYFLGMLKLKRRRSGYPAPEGTPKWWERKAGKEYLCSSCSRSIQKTERYIGRKTLSPGQKGIYGYRGTYHTHYFHIICLLKEAQDNLKARINKLDIEMQFLEREIVDLKGETSTKTREIEMHDRTRKQEEEDYQGSTRFGKVTKWFGCKYRIWVLNKENRRLQERIDQIQYREIPDRRRRIGEKSARKSDLQRDLETIEADIKKLE